MLKFWKRADSNDRDESEKGEPAPQINPSSEPPSGWLGRLRAGLAKTSTNITSLFVGAKVDEALFDELESALLAADAGVDATQDLIERLRHLVKKDDIADAGALQSTLADLLTE